ncbi:dGTPase [Aeromonas veronii]|uniref:dGTPase n=1 Tax=Aeromonas veronii TaxID=654 RepID=UPI002416EE2C|nr:dGTPase [Aeromonas veronii]WFO51560.1 dGTPase [Aeromonas veronii]
MATIEQSSNPQLLSKKRFRPSKATHDDLLSATLSDRARYIYSPAFRRLQMKAQVFSLENNAAVRSRLTHSMEVAHIGIFIVQKITEIIKGKSDIHNHVSPQEVYIYENAQAIRNVVETACLIHDVGNPPFGHFGESAISSWFTDNKGELFDAHGVAEKDLHNYEDFLNFDGNPQGLRIVTKLQGYDGFGLNLTTSQIASIIKYTASNKDIAVGGLHKKKMGYFSTEEALVKDVWSDLGIDERGKRHPLVYIMEAADDISYCISDIEDGIEKGIVSYEKFFVFLKNKLDYNFRERNSEHDVHLGKVLTEIDVAYNLSMEALTNSEDSKSLAEHFILLKTYITNLSVQEVAEIFLEDLDSIMTGDSDSIVDKAMSSVGKIQKALKDFTSRYIFTSEEAEKIELSGYSVIYGLMDNFAPLLKMSEDKFQLLINGDNKKIRKNKLFVHSRLFNLLPSKHIDEYKRTTPDDAGKIVEFNHRCHLIVDYISGMTDGFSVELYQLLTGIKVK